MGLGDDELMLHRQHRHVQAHHRAGGAGVAAGGRDHMLAADVASGGLDQPIAALALNGRHPGLADDFRPLGAGAPGQGLGEVRRLNVAVVGVADGAHQAVNVAQGPEVAHLVRFQKLHPHADGAGGGRVLTVLVHALLAHSQADVADLPEADVLTGFSLKLLIQVDRILVNLADAVAHVEQRQQPRRVPS